MRDVSLPDLFCPACRTKGAPGAGFLEGAGGPSDQIAFWCKTCGQQIPVSVEWRSPEFSRAVLGSLNPFSDAFPSLRERIASASRPRAVVPDSLAEARVWLQSRLDEGVDCLCCDQHAQRYYRRVNSGMARWLIALAHLSPPGTSRWVPTRDVIVYAAGHKSFGSSIGSGESPSLLPYWGLIETRPNEDPEKKHSGFWRPTERGHLFVRGDLAIPRTAVVYNNTLERLEGDAITIRQCLGKKFELDDLRPALTGEAV